MRLLAFNYCCDGIERICNPVDSVNRVLNYKATSINVNNRFVLNFLTNKLSQIRYVYTNSYNEAQLLKLAGLCNRFNWAFLNESIGHYEWESDSASNLQLQHLLYALEDYACENDPSDPGIIFQGGWIGHSIMYRVHKEGHDQNGNPLYTFSLFNTGELLGEYHPFIKKMNSYELEEIYYQTGLQWSGLSFEQVSKREFLRNIIEAKYKKCSLESNVYTIIEAHFGPRDPSSSNLADYRKEQKAGTCPYKPDGHLINKVLREGEDAWFPLSVKAHLTTLLQKDFEATIPPAMRTELDHDLLFFIEKAKEKRTQKAAYLQSRLGKSGV